MTSSTLGRDFAPSECSKADYLSPDKPPPEKKTMRISLSTSIYTNLLSLPESNGHRPDNLLELGSPCQPRCTDDAYDGGVEWGPEFFPKREGSNSPTIANSPTRYKKFISSLQARQLLAIENKISPSPERKGKQKLNKPTEGKIKKKKARKHRNKNLQTVVKGLGAQTGKEVENNQGEVL